MVLFFLFLFSCIIYTRRWWSDSRMFEDAIVFLIYGHYSNFIRASLISQNEHNLMFRSTLFTQHFEGNRNPRLFQIVKHNNVAMFPVFVVNTKPLNALQSEVELLFRWNYCRNPTYYLLFNGSALIANKYSSGSTRYFYIFFYGRSVSLDGSKRIIVQFLPLFRLIFMIEGRRILRRKPRLSLVNYTLAYSYTTYDSILSSV